MKSFWSSAALATAVALMVASAAPAAGPPDNQGTRNAAAKKPSSSSEPGPSASLPAKAKAYGRYCQGESKKQVAGQKGTAFSQCVTAMAKLATRATSSPRVACAALSKQRVPGQKGTPFSRCVSGGATLLADQQQNS